MTRHPFGSARRLAPLALTMSIGLGLTLTACGEDAEPVGTSNEATTPTAEPTEPAPGSTTESVAPSIQTIDITVADGKITPSGERVEVTAGEEFNLAVTADEPGEIHVHATPAQELSYSEGSTTLPLTIDQPGLVDVESHNLDVVIVQLEVR